ncbi:MAG: hypothetical protein ACYDBH_19150 [Acidobacteriaceae bacterium]
MTTIRGSAFCGVLLYVFLITAATAADKGWYVPRLVVGSHTGLPTQIIAPQIGAARILVAPMSLALREGGRVVPVRGAYQAARDDYVIDQPDRGLIMELKYGRDRLPYVDWVVKGNSNNTGGLTATFLLTIQSSADHAFFPAGTKPRIVLARGGAKVTYSYSGPGIPTAMPLGQVYTPQGDWGLAFFGPLGARTEHIITTVSRSKKSVLVRITLNMPRPIHGTTSRRLYFAVTRGDWRPALGAVLARFPRVFEPHNPEVAAIQGPMANSTGTPPNSVVRGWRAQGTRLVIVHGTFPFYGRYIARHKVWTSLVDDRWHRLKEHLPASQRPANTASWQEIQHFVQQQDPPDLTVAKVNDYIRRLHGYGMKGVIYVNPTEAWAPWAAATFPQDRVLSITGKPVPTWLESVEMIADKHNAWGKYLLSQIRAQLRIYPHIDGVFFDEATAGGRKLFALCKAACGLVHAQGKICWWGGPYTVPLETLADGMMIQGGGGKASRQPTNIIQYYGLAGKLISSQGPVTDASYASMLVHGLIPQPVTAMQRTMGERWFPLFTWLRNRSWVLWAHALQTTAGVQANLFRVPDGNLVVVLARKPFPTGKLVPLFDVHVRVRTPHTGLVRAVYFLTPDLLGDHKLPFIRHGDELSITIPRFGPAGVLVLAKTGLFTALAGSLDVVRGHSQAVRWTVDNWTATPKYVFLALDNPLGTHPISGRIPADSTQSLKAPIKIPPHDTDSRLEMVASTRMGGKTRTDKAELWIDPPLLMTAESPGYARNGETHPLVVKLLGHVRRTHIVDVRIASAHWQFKNATQHVALTPHTVTTLTIDGRALKAGKSRIRITATGGAGQLTARTSVPVEVVATALAPSAFRNIRSAELTLEVFAGNDRAHKPVYLNGVDVGDLPEGNGNQWTARTMLLPRKAIAALRPHNTITIDNQVRDAFNVRDFRLRLHLRNGITVVSTTDKQAYASGMGWLYGQGKPFVSGQPLTGISVDIPGRASP